MSTLNLSPSTRKFIRLEKARIRRQFLDTKKQEEMIGGLYKKFLNQPAGEVKVVAKPKAVKAKKPSVKTK